MSWRSLALIAGAMLLGACATAARTAPTASAPSQSAPTAFTLSSRDLSAGRWPAAATCDGDDQPPDLHWTSGPKGTASYAIEVRDQDAPNGGFTHWMLADEPPALRQPTPGTGVSGKNDFGHEGYEGPCPPKGSGHHYVVTAYAVDTMVDLAPLYSHGQFRAALSGHVLAQSSVTATYAR